MSGHKNDRAELDLPVLYGKTLVENGGWPWRLHLIYYNFKYLLRIMSAVFALNNYYQDLITNYHDF